MDIIPLLITLIGGIGIGTIIQAVLSNQARKKELLDNRIYKEKRNAYLGLIAALHEAAVNPSDKSSKGYALWQTRIGLFGSDEVVKFAQAIVDTEPGSNERNTAFSHLILSMKKDLGIAKS